MGITRDDFQAAIDAMMGIEASGGQHLDNGSNVNQVMFESDLDSPNQEQVYQR